MLAPVLARVVGGDHPRVESAGTGQFIIRGDGIGTHNVTVNFQGFLSGGGLAENFPISGVRISHLRELVVALAAVKQAA